MTGRYHRGADRYPPSETWPALYTALAPHIALGEMVRHTSAIAEFANKRLSRLHIRLQAVLDGTDLAASRLPGSPGFADFCHPGRFELTHAVAVAVPGLGAEALLTPSCTRFAGNNLIVFVDRLRVGSSIAVVDSEDPDLYIDWTAI